MIYHAHIALQQKRRPAGQSRIRVIYTYCVLHNNMAKARATREH